jgi:addiction module RelE/StbE family toxin
MDEIVWTEEALSDLEAIGTYFEQTSPSYAPVIVRRLYRAVDQLADHPRIGRIVPEVGHESLRERIVENYRIIYQLREGRIEVITIVHGRQDVAKKFGGRGEGN